MNTRPHIIVVGLGLGDEAKGATVDWLSATTRPEAVVRFSGGAQAAHNVIVDGVHHTFRQYGSGTLAGTPTFSARSVSVDPWLLAAETEQLEAIGVDDPLSRLAISRNALVTTPVHIVVNRTREDLRGAGRHGSCGLGVGETRWYALAARARLRAGDELFGLVAERDVTDGPITVGDCLEPSVLAAKLSALTEFYQPLVSRGRHRATPPRTVLDTLLAFGEAVRVVDDVDHLRESARRGHLVFEGSQGVLLDEWRGLHPHTTWTTTLPSAAQDLLGAAGLAPARVLGAVRAYATRHGAGPLPTEDEMLIGVLPEPHNGTGEYQGDWRVGHLDLPLLRYAARVCRRHGGLDGIAVSHLDRFADADGAVKVASRYRGNDGYRLGDYRDLGHQAGLTDAARAAVPVLEDLDVAEVPEVLAGVTAPAVVLADGPARDDRHPAGAGTGAVGTLAA